MASSLSHIVCVFSKAELVLYFQRTSIMPHRIHDGFLLAFIRFQVTVDTVIRIIYIWYKMVHSKCTWSKATSLSANVSIVHIKIFLLLPKSELTLFHVKEKRKYLILLDVTWTGQSFCPLVHTTYCPCCRQDSLSKIRTIWKTLKTTWCLFLCH